jgi:DtxR family Mn-dependent transcriptional regulator
VKGVNIKKTSVSSHAEEYLEAIYRLERKGGFARTMELARKLNVVPGSVTNTIENLEERGLVIHEPYKGVRLTEKGRGFAATVLRRHRLAERLLTDILHMDWSQVHEAACKLEHALSPEIIKPLEKVLRHPKTCPHGNPIPTKCGRIFEEKTEALSELDVKIRGIIFKIVEEKTEVLQQLQRLGLTPGKNIEVEERLPTGPLTVRLGDESLRLNHKLASIIYVKRIEEE